MTLSYSSSSTKVGADRAGIRSLVGGSRKVSTRMATPLNTNSPLSSYKSKVKGKKSLSNSLRSFRHRRRSRASKSNVRQTNGLELWEVCEKGVDLAYVESTIELFPGLIHLEQRGRTPLFIACRNGHAAIAALLLQAGATDPDCKIYHSTENQQCKALLEQYRVVERALSISSDHDNGNVDTTKRTSTASTDPLEEDESCDTPQTANLSSAASRIQPEQQERTVIEGDEEEEEVISREFNACASLAAAEDDDNDETEPEVQFWMSRFLSKQQDKSLPSSSSITTTTTSTTADPLQGLHQDQQQITLKGNQEPQLPQVDEQPAISSLHPQQPLQHQRSLLSTTEQSDDDQDDQQVEDHIQEQSYCGLVNCAKNNPPETFQESTALVVPKDKEAPHDDPIDPIPEPPLRICFSLRQHSLQEDVADPLPAACVSSQTSTNISSKSSNSSHLLQQQQSTTERTVECDNKDSSRAVPGNNRGCCEYVSFMQPQQQSSPSISFSSLESFADDDCSDSQASQQHVPTTTRTFGWNRESPVVVEQAIECTLVPAKESSSSPLLFRSLSPWRSLRRSRNRYLLDDHSLVSSSNLISEDDKESVSSTVRAVEMTLEEFQEKVTDEQILRQDLIQLRQKRSQLRQKVNNLLEDTDSCYYYNDDEISGVSSSSHTRSTLSDVNEDGCDPSSSSCCIGIV